MKKEWQNSTYPYARVKDDPAFVKYVQNNLWSKRRERGFPWRMNVFDFICNTYGEKSQHNWLKKGMVQGDLIGLDDKLYIAYHERVARYGQPEGFSFPSEAQARLDAIKDPHERKKREIAREFFREHSAYYRQRKKEDRQP